MAGRERREKPGVEAGVFAEEGIADGEGWKGEKKTNPWRQKVRDVEFAASGLKGEAGKSPPRAQRDSGGGSETETGMAKIWDK